MGPRGFRSEEGAWRNGESTLFHLTGLKGLSQSKTNPNTTRGVELATVAYFEHSLKSQITDSVIVRLREDMGRGFFYPTQYSRPHA